MDQPYEPRDRFEPRFPLYVRLFLLMGWMFTSLWFSVDHSGKMPTKQTCPEGTVASQLICPEDICGLMCVPEPALKRTMPRGGAACENCLGDEVPSMQEINKVRSELERKH